MAPDTYRGKHRRTGDEAKGERLDLIYLHLLMLLLDALLGEAYAQDVSDKIKAMQEAGLKVRSIIPRLL